MCTRPLTYNFDTKPYQQNIQITLDRLCNGVTVLNAGTSNLSFQGDVLAPGTSKSIGGNFGEILRGRVDLQFTGAGANLAVVTEKYYNPGQWIEKEPGI
jgi:hypothetical protein